MNHGNLKCWIVFASILQHQKRAESLETTDQHQSVKLEFLEPRGHGAEVDIWKGAIGTKLRSTTGHPTVHSKPRKFLYKIVQQAPETIVYRKRYMVLASTISHCSTGGGI